MLARWWTSGWRVNLPPPLGTAAAPATAGAVAVPLIISGALGLPPEQRTLLINADLFACGLATLVQAFGFPGVGIRAGDLLPPPAGQEVNTAGIIATGFLALGPKLVAEQDKVKMFYDAVDEQIDVVGKVFLGLTISCARCHDHKFDPLLQRDYYKLTATYQAVWDPENWLAGSLNFGPWPSRMVLDMAPEKREAWIKDVTSSGAKLLRRKDDLLEATYQKFRAELKAGRELPAERRAQLRLAIENDPDLEVDRTAPKDGLTDAELDAKFPEFAQWKAEIAALRANRKKNQSTVEPNYIEAARSEERRVGKECRSRWSPYH